jgi:hypothetical protein
MIDADKTDEGERQTVDHFAFPPFTPHVRKMKTDLTPTLPSPVRETGRPFRLLSAGTDHEMTKLHVFFSVLQIVGYTFIHSTHVL